MPSVILVSSYPQSHFLLCDAPYSLIVYKVLCSLPGCDLASTMLYLPLKALEFIAFLEASIHSAKLPNPL